MGRSSQNTPGCPASHGYCSAAAGSGKAVVGHSRCATGGRHGAQEAGVSAARPQDRIGQRWRSCPSGHRGCADILATTSIPAGDLRANGRIWRSARWTRTVHPAPGCHSRAPGLGPSGISEANANYARRGEPAALNRGQLTVAIYMARISDQAFQRRLPAIPPQRLMQCHRP